jgi:DNA-binding MurR/RpiR family transcriptional regulator
MMAKRAGSSKNMKAKAAAPIDLETLLRARMTNLSPSEQSLAAYMLENVQLLPFETGASIAETVGVSEMTVSRFVRSLGFDSLRDLKGQLRLAMTEEDSEIDDTMERFQVRNSRQRVLKESLRLELDAIVKAYALTGTNLWGEAVDALANAPTVYVIGFQASKGLALDFASRLLWSRPGIIHIDNASGTFGEIVTADPTSSLVVLVDTAAYAMRGIKLAEKLKTLDMPLVVVTDKFSHWALSYTRLVFEGHTHVQTFWDSSASLSVILNLLIDSVAVRLGAKARARFDTMSSLGDMFGEFVGGRYLAKK